MDTQESKVRTPSSLRKWNNTGRTMGNQEFESRATSIVRNWYSKYATMTPTEIYVVWMVKVLRNNKAMIASNHSDGRYFEVTWDGERERFYLDVYSKIENHALNIEGESAWLQR